MTGKYEVTAQSEKYGPAYYTSNDFRVYEPQMIKGSDNLVVTMTLCEEYDAESDRWEPFFSHKPV